MGNAILESKKKISENAFTQFFVIPSDIPVSRNDFFVRIYFCKTMCKKLVLREICFVVLKISLLTKKLLYFIIAHMIFQECVIFYLYLSSIVKYLYHFVTRNQRNLFYIVHIIIYLFLKANILNVSSLFLNFLHFIRKKNHLNFNYLHSNEMT